MKLQVKWQDLDMSRSSIMGLFDGKYINAVSQLGEEFFLLFCHDRHYNKIIFIQSQLNETYIKICDTKMQMEQIASKFAYALQNNTSQEILKCFDFKKI